MIKHIFLYLLLLASPAVLADNISTFNGIRMLDGTNQSGKILTILDSTGRLGYTTAGGGTATNAVGSVNLMTNANITITNGAGIAITNGNGLIRISSPYVNGNGTNNVLTNATVYGDFIGNVKSPDAGIDTVAIFDHSGNLVGSAEVTIDQFNFLGGVTSSIQAQIDALMTGTNSITNVTTVNMAGNALTNKLSAGLSANGHGINITNLCATNTTSIVVDAANTAGNTTSLVITTNGLLRTFTLTYTNYVTITNGTYLTNLTGSSIVTNGANVTVTISTNANGQKTYIVASSGGGGSFTGNDSQFHDDAGVTSIGRSSDLAVLVTNVYIAPFAAGQPLTVVPTGAGEHAIFLSTNGSQLCYIRSGNFEGGLKDAAQLVGSAYFDSTGKLISDESGTNAAGLISEAKLFFGTNMLKVAENGVDDYDISNRTLVPFSSPDIAASYLSDLSITNFGIEVFPGTYSAISQCPYLYLHNGVNIISSAGLGVSGGSSMIIDGLGYIKITSGDGFLVNNDSLLILNGLSLICTNADQNALVNVGSGVLIANFKYKILGGTGAVGAIKWGGVGGYTSVTAPTIDSDGDYGAMWSDVDAESGDCWIHADNSGSYVLYGLDTARNWIDVKNITGAINYQGCRNYILNCSKLDAHLVTAGAALSGGVGSIWGDFQKIIPSPVGAIQFGAETNRSATIRFHHISDEFNIVTNTYISASGSNCVVSGMLLSSGTNSLVAVATAAGALVDVKQITGKLTPLASNIAASGWTNTFGIKASVYVDGVAVTCTLYNGNGTSVYTNAATLSHSEFSLLHGWKLITSGTGVTGRAIPLQ